MKDPILLLSCTAFAIPMTYAAYCQLWYIYGAHLSMLMTSIAFHSSKNELLMRIDQLCLLHLLSLSIKTGYELQLVYLPIFGIIWSAYVYIYGYKTTSLAFSPYYIESRIYHASMHLLVSGLWVYGIYTIQNNKLIE
jgi:hypothetical protein